MTTVLSQIFVVFLISALITKSNKWMWRGAIGTKQVYRACGSWFYVLPAMDDFSKNGFSGNHIPLIPVLICIISIDKKYIVT